MPYVTINELYNNKFILTMIFLNSLLYTYIICSTITIYIYKIHDLYWYMLSAAANILFGLSCVIIISYVIFYLLYASINLSCIILDCCVDCSKFVKKKRDNDMSGAEIEIGAIYI